MFDQNRAGVLGTGSLIEKEGAYIIPTKTSSNVTLKQKCEEERTAYKQSLTTVSIIPVRERSRVHFKKVYGMWWVEVGFYPFDVTLIYAPTWQECWKIYSEANYVPQN